MNFAPDSYPMVDHPNTRNWKDFNPIHEIGNLSRTKRYFR
jgi:hypothetical protein